MQAPPLPLDETKRLDSLFGLNLLDTPAEERFDRITRLAQRLFQVAASGISLVDATRQWFKSSQGMSFPQMARQISFCGHTIAAEDLLVVEDTTRDPRFADNPLVVGEPYIRFYAGHPLMTEEGSAIGTLAIFDSRPRRLNDEDLQSLRDLALIASAELRTSRFTPAQLDLVSDRRRAASGEVRIDALTRLWNRGAILEILERELEYATRNAAQMGLVLADVDQLKAINDRAGFEAGDAALREVAKRLRACLRPYDSVGRYAGEEFLMILPGADADNSYAAAERIRVTVGQREGRPAATPVTISLGVVAIGQGRTTAEALIRAAERALHQAKVSGGNRAAFGNVA